MPLQFTLRTLLLLFVVVAAALGVGGLWVLAGVAYLAYLVISIRLAMASRCGCNLVVATILFPLAAVLLPPLISTAHEAARRAQCTNNIRQLARALLNYEAQYGSFPPAFIADKSGQPMHSWRVLILPEMGCEHLYSAFRLDEPWNSPHNRKIASQMPSPFRCPSHENAPPGTTDYVAVTGPGTIWPKGQRCKFEDITDGKGCTLMFVEAAGANVPWNAPRDLTLQEVLTHDPTESITSYHDHEAEGILRPMGNVAFADGSVDFLHGRLTAKSFKALATIADGKPHECDDLGYDIEIIPPDPPPGVGSQTFLFWSRLIGWAILVVSFVLLVSRPLPQAWLRPAEKTTTPEETGNTTE
ncbi:MAG: DUF1559 domain-containing protein [Pirellulales bacterium]|nr:DUF1559 domain-containing protein [Pirellulales bacterium]